MGGGVGGIEFLGGLYGFGLGGGGVWWFYVRLLELMGEKTKNLSFGRTDRLEERQLIF
jgi:hypothetical protein